MEAVELASNLVWLCTALAILGGTVRAAHRRRTNVSPFAAIMLAGVICLLLLPAISISDDLLDARQATLPAAEQTWRLASDSASVFPDLVPVLISFLALVAAFIFLTPAFREGTWNMRPHSAWLMRSLRLRPPPVFAL